MLDVKIFIETGYYDYFRCIMRDIELENGVFNNMSLRDIMKNKPLFNEIINACSYFFINDSISTEDDIQKDLESLDPDTTYFIVGNVHA